MRDYISSIVSERDFSTTVKEQREITANDVYLSSYRFVSYTELSSEDIQKLSSNTLYGIVTDNQGNTILEEVIAQNVPLVRSETDGNGGTYTPVASKKYTGFKLIFNDTITSDEFKNIHIAFDYSTVPSKQMVAEKLREVENLYPDNVQKSVELWNKAGMYVTTDENGASATISKAYQMSVVPVKFDMYGNSGTATLFSGNELFNESYFTLSNLLVDRTTLTGQYIMLVPEGLEPISIETTEDTFKIANKPSEVIPNYQGTGQTAYIFDYHLSEGNKYSSTSYTIYTKLKATLSMQPGKYAMGVALTWDQSEVVQGGYPSTDTFDLNRNGSITDKIHFISRDIIYNTPEELVVTKSVKASEESNYHLDTKVDKDSDISYRLQLFNRSRSKIERNVSLIEVLPRIGDRRIVENETGEYVNRGSQFDVFLKEAIPNVEGYTVYYSTDAPVANLSENLSANWKTADQISDFSSVRMIKLQMNDGVELAPNTFKEFYVSARVGDNAEVGQIAYNSVGLIKNNSPVGAIESVSSSVQVVDYTVSGKVYADIAKDGVYQDQDSPLANRTVKLYKVENGVETLVDTKTTDASGDYAFKVNYRGDYKVTVEPAIEERINDKAVKSNVLIVGNDVNAKGQKDFTLSLNHPNEVINVAIYSEEIAKIGGKVEAKFVSEFGREIKASEIVVRDQEVGTDYNALDKGVRMFEERGYIYYLKKTPENVQGKVTKEDQTVTFVYAQGGRYIPEVPGMYFPDVPYDKTPEEPSDNPALPYVPGYTPKDKDGNPLKPVDPEDKTKGYVPPSIVNPQDPTENTRVPY
ncbi:MULTISPECIES: SdrD B-like domain-containing protein, partial [unclassified Granulicatella]|uniref:SdrD B-like domain-containing protein n=1 Tax=unclassified Granulicatella TaxID=2630493 RepID=UPI001073CCB1